MSFTRDTWVRAFLCGIGNCNPNQQTINWVINWTAAENNQPTDTFNLLNTTQPMPGSVGGGTQGNIQKFVSFDQGIQATVITLKNGRYNSLLQALQTNNTSALGFGGSPSSGVMSDLNTWCGNCGYGNWFASQSPNSGWLAQSYAGGPGAQSTTGGTATTSSTSGNPLDLGTQIVNALGLPTTAQVQAFIQQFMIITFGIIMVLIGVLVVFFSSDASKKVS